jgi:hypothetical protein
MHHDDAGGTLGGTFPRACTPDAIDLEAARLQDRAQHFFRLAQTVDDQNALPCCHAAILVFLLAGRIFVRRKIVAASASIVLSTAKSRPCRTHPALQVFVAGRENTAIDKSCQNQNTTINARLVSKACKNYKRADDRRRASFFGD